MEFTLMSIQSNPSLYVFGFYFSCVKLCIYAHQYFCFEILVDCCWLLVLIISDFDYLRAEK